MIRIKSTLILTLIIICILSGTIFTGCLSNANEYINPGIYEAAEQGYRGIIRVRVYLSSGGMEDIEILENYEDRHAVEAIEELRELALEINTVDLDAISGATISSRAFLSALEAAIAKAME